MPVRLGGPFAASPAELLGPSLLCSLPRRITGRLIFFFFLLAKAQSRKEIVPPSLRLGGFAACPAELRGANNFFFFYSRKDAETQRNCGPSKKGSPSRNPASFKNKILWVKFN
jgi:hypothetical protein